MISILVRPVITERSMMNAQNGRFTFIVAKSAKKEDIKNAVEKKFNVHVKEVATTLTKGRTMRIGKRREEKMLQAHKKAIVMLEKGEKISLFEAVA